MSAATTDRFEPEAGSPYAQCTVDAMVLQTREEAEKHMRASLDAAPADEHGNRRGHRILITNRTREERIRDFIADAERMAVDDAVDEIIGAINAGHLTQTEALAAPYCNGLVEDELKEALR